MTAIAYKWSIPGSSFPLVRLFAKRRVEFLITYTNLVHDGDPRILYLLFKLEHGWGDITRGDNVLLVPNRRLDNGYVESVWD